MFNSAAAYFHHHIIMKKSIIKTCLATAGILFMSCLAACSDDDTPAGQPIDKNIIENGLSVYAQSNIVEIPVEAAGAWSVSVPDTCDWLTVLNDSGNGRDVMTIVLDDNIGGEMRTVTATLNAGGATTEFRISQYGELDGIVADNGDNDYIQTAATKKLGVGCNLIEYYDSQYKKGTPVGLNYSRNSVFNLASLEKLLDSGEDDYANIVSAVPRANLNFEAANMDSIIDKRDSLGVAFQLNVSYAKFHFGISGAYHGNEDLKDHTMKLAYSAEYPTLDAGISYMDALTHYSNYMAEENAPKNDFRKTILTTGMAGLRKNIETAVKSNNTAVANRYIRQLVNNYGTGVVVGSTLGGRITMDLDMDSLYIKEVMRVDTATVKVGFELGLFKLDADVEVSYLNSSISVLQNSRYKLEVAGGDMTKAGEVLTALSNADYSDTGLPDRIKDWAYSIRNDVDYTKCNADLLQVDIIPIWEIFDDFECQDAVITYLEGIYPNSTFIKRYLAGESTDIRKVRIKSKHTR